LKLQIYIGDGNEGFQNSIDNLLDKVSLNICERLAEEQQKKSIEIGKQVEYARDKLKQKLDVHSLFDFDQEVYEKTESSKESILLKQNKKLHKLRENKRQSQLERKNEACYTMQKQKRQQQLALYNVKTTSQQQRHSNVKTASQQQRDSNVKTASQQQRHSNVKTASQQQRHSNVKITSQQQRYSNVKTTSQQQRHSNVKAASQQQRKDPPKDQKEQQKNWFPHGTMKKSYAEAVIMGESESMTKTLAHLVEIIEQLQKTYKNQIPGDSIDVIIGDNGKKNKNGERKFREVKRQC
jgi:hypothetical protein